MLISRIYNARILSMVVLLGLAALLSGCSTGEPTVTLSGQEYTIEITDTPKARRTGLMYRTELAKDSGMLFIYDSARSVSFWMKNTLIPLDILYFDADQKLQQIYADTPPCKTNPCPLYPSSQPTRYILELNAGESAEIGAKIGDELTLNYANKR